MAENPAVNYSAPIFRLRLARNGTVEFFLDSKIVAKEGSVLVRIVRTQFSSSKYFDRRCDAASTHAISNNSFQCLFVVVLVLEYRELDTGSLWSRWWKVWQTRLTESYVGGSQDFPRCSISLSFQFASLLCATCNGSIGSWSHGNKHQQRQCVNILINAKNNLNTKTHKRKMCTQFSLILYRNHQNKETSVNLFSWEGS